MSALSQALEEAGGVAAPPELTARLRELVAAPVTDDADHAEALALLRSSASLRGAAEVLQEYADRARQRLAAVPDGEVREALSALCDYVVTRTS
jgi:heptaprenyl diphosphate synthase